MITDNAPLDHVYHILYSGSKDNVAGSNIEKYFDDYKHVRLVPYKVLMERTHSYTEIQGVAEKKWANEYIQFKNDGYVNVNDKFMKGPAPGSARNHYRSQIKAQWLITDIQEKGLKEPITAVVYPKYDHMTQKIGYKSVIHPGSFRQYVLRMLDLDPLCIVWDAYEVFPEYEKANIHECLALFQDDSTRFEIAILPTNGVYLTPQLLNIHSKAIQANIMTTCIQFEEKCRSQWNSDLNIFVGYDSKHPEAFEVCKDSIYRAFADKPNEESGVRIIGLDMNEIECYTREYANQSTEFSYTRWLAPYLSGYKGWSIFVDDDFVFNASVINLLYYINHEKAVSVVKYDYEKKYDTKFAGEKDVWYPKKLWSSLMVFNNEHPDCQKLTPEVVNTASGKYLHQFEWTSEDKIGEIPKKWVWTEGYDDVRTIHDHHAMHWTRGGPWIKDMDCSHIDGIEIWDANRALNIDKKKYPLKFRSILDPRKYFDMDFFVLNKYDSGKNCGPVKIGEKND